MSDPAALDRRHKLVIIASSLGTMFEWYDFFIYGTLAAFFGKLFFPPGNESAAYLSSLALFGVGFSVRPFGALFFGRLGDLVGRKHTFLLTIILMGLSTTLVGLLPTYAKVGFAAPLSLVILRLTQGLALGGEYGGAVIYVAEHAPKGRRGLYTGWIQTTSTVGLFLALVVIGLLRHFMTVAQFADWGWRVPFLISFVLLGISVYMRLKLEESPIYAEMRAQGKGSKAPLTDSFGTWANARIVLTVLFGSTAAQGVVWYAGQFYSLYFLTTTLGVDYVTAYKLVGASLVVGALMAVGIGGLSDIVGRKKIVMTGFLLAALTYQPIFHGLTRAANPALADAMERSPVVLRTGEYKGPVALAVDALADAAVKIVHPSTARTETDKARNYLNAHGIPFALAPLPSAGAQTSLVVGSGAAVVGFSEKAYEAALAPAGYPKKADPASMNVPVVVALLIVLLGFSAMVYGPIAAFLVELFPTRIRYTSMSLPYHIGNGWFGGFLPLIATSIVVFTGNIYAGLWYPIAVAAMSFVVGSLLLPETKDRDLRD
jgi:MFS family permease